MRALDRRFLRLLRERGHGPPVERAIKAFSRSGEHGAFWFALAAACAAADRDRASGYRRAATTVAIAYLTNIGFKYAIRRPRPAIEALPPLSSTVTSLSYPSAHAATSFAAARSLSGALPAPPLYATAAAMALSRSYLGLHYPSDILAGAALGWAVAGLR